jgi:hypothetical protein
MNRTQAGMIVGRLNAHYPSVAANDLAAEDWVNAVVALEWDDAQTIAASLITGWAKDRAPRLSDWQEAARHQAQHRRLAAGSQPREIEAEPIQPDRIAVLIAEAKQAVTRAKHKPKETRK